MSKSFTILIHHYPPPPLLQLRLHRDLLLLPEDPDSGAGDKNLCRWLYDTFQSTEPPLQLLVPLVAGLYLSRVPLRQPQAGFEAVLLARAGQAITVNIILDLSHSTVISIRTVRFDHPCAKILGVALELYYSKITWMSRESKLNFCESCEKWAGTERGDGGP
ncbi:unnamed protein product [Eruca vesicaria subsp. sativa]|uniref:Uncharacterized protein n=1 Tax=Eruca vesicaria subsp. sativa TaxID=29727 RepID=A0ABC8LIN8_ERUVS|nr:unnamed protein product [Eruca vesicaria subsp. sativa]